MSNATKKAKSTKADKVAAEAAKDLEDLQEKRRLRKAIDDAVIHIGAVNVVQLKRGQWRIRELRPKGVAMLQKRINIRWDTASRISILEEVEDLVVAREEYIRKHKIEDESSIPEWKLVEELVAEEQERDPDWVPTAEWIASPEVHWEDRIFRYIDGNHRMAAVQFINVKREELWANEEKEEERAKKGIIEPIRVIPTCALYSATRLSSSGLTALDVATCLNQEADNVQTSKLDKIYLIRVHAK